MNPRQHPISIHLQRLLSALLPGGFWQAGQHLSKPCPAGLVAIRVTKHDAMRDRAYLRGERKA